MLDTRGRLSNAFRDLREAFLVVFRLGGRRVEFPEGGPYPGGVIYTFWRIWTPRLAVAARNTLPSW